MALFGGVNTTRYKVQERKDRFNTHSRDEQAANAGGLLQTSLSEVPRRQDSRYDSAVLRRGTPDKVLAFISLNPAIVNRQSTV